MLSVGVTGGIGSGKSTVCRVFECLGIPVYRADDRAKWLTENHPEIRREIILLLGDEAYSKEGRYNTGYVSGRVFADRVLLESLNRIIHPRVQEDTRLWIGKQENVPYVVKEAAIMSKAGPVNGLDFVVSVISPESLRIERVLARDRHRSREQVQAIIASQSPESYFLEIADFVVRNSEEELIIPQVLKIHDELAARISATGRD